MVCSDCTSADCRATWSACKRAIELHKLLHQLLVGGRRLLHCDDATMFLVTDRQTLRFESRTRGDALPSLEIPLTTR